MMDRMCRMASPVAALVGGLALLGASTAGCGSSKPGYRPEMKPDGGATGGTGMDGGGTPQQDAPSAVPDRPAPMTSSTAIKLFNGAAFLIGTGPSCTYEPGATGDRWCVFGADSTVNLGNVDLFVVNVSRAVAPGGSVTCGGAAGSNPDCLRLTTAAAFDSQHPLEFTGD